MAKFDVVEQEDVSLLVRNGKLESSVAFKDVFFFFVRELLTVAPVGAVWSLLVRKLIELIELIPVVTTGSDELI